VPSRQASAENESRNAHDEARSVELSFTETADPKQNSNLVEFRVSGFGFRVVRNQTNSAL